MTWETVIGLEIHVQLNTQSKIFSGASTAFGAEPNAHASVVECALPGVLPVMNREVVEKAIKLGLALDAKINQKNVFDRKNYFYPDLPKGYQISQLDLPIVEHGKLEIVVGDDVKTINVTRAHMEEDAGKSVHEGLNGATGIDLNRAGTPLLEVVSEPEMRSAAEAVAYAKALHSLVTWLDICDGNMAEGSFRVDANVSVRPKGQAEFGTRREIKNLNSFRFLEQAINYEVEAQIEILEDGGKVQQATMLFDPEKGETRVMRLKEDAHDYRYFPDPDLLPVIISDGQMDKARDEMSELQHEIIKRFMEDCRLSGYDAYLVTATPAHAELLENSLNFNVLMQVTNGNQQREQIKEGSWLAEILKCIQKLGTKKFNLNQVYQYENELSKIFPNNKHIKAKIRQQLQILRKKGLIEFIDNNGNYINRDNGNYINRAKIIANIMNGMLASKLNKEGLELADSPIADKHLDALVGKISDGTLSSKLAKKAFEAMWAEPEATIAEIIEKHGLQQMTDTGAIEAMVDEVLANNAKAVEQFKSGNEKALNAIVGQVMKASKGKANPAQVQELIKAKLA
ncbi:Asp-tRNA(Asn)/Glu-tRNA(Gln) amidotransferase subunit GatB [Neisseria sicca]